MNVWLFKILVVSVICLSSEEPTPNFNYLEAIGWDMILCSESK